MKFVLSILLTALLSFIAGLYLPWWSIAVVSFLTALLLRQQLVWSFLSGFLGIFLLWVVVATWIDVKNESILSHRMAQLFPLGGSTFLLIFITGLLGGTVGGFAALAASSLVSKKKVMRLEEATG